jgi:hypothetical protein
MVDANGMIAAGGIAVANRIPVSAMRCEETPVIGHPSRNRRAPREAGLLVYFIFEHLVACNVRHVTVS